MLLWNFWKQLTPWLAVCLIALAEIVYAQYTIKITDCTKGIYDILAAKNQSTITPFAYQLLLLCLVVYATCNFSNYLVRVLQVYWNRSLTLDLTHYWLESEHFLNPKLQNINQRITENSNNITYDLLTLMHILLRVVFLVGAFAFPLYKISFTIYGKGYLLPCLILCMGLCGSFISNLFVIKISKIKNAIEEANANVRSHLHYVELNNVQVLLNQGIVKEEQMIADKVRKCVWLNVHKLIWVNVWLFLFGLYDKLNTMFALFILAPKCLSGHVTLGTLQQAGVLCYFLSDAFSFWARNTRTIANIKTSFLRIRELILACDKRRCMPIYHDKNSVMIDLQYLKHSDKVLLTNLKLEFKLGHKIMLTGSSGVGKTTLIKAIAGLHNDYQGDIVLPVQSVFCSSQLSYIPQLSDAYGVISYPYEYPKEMVRSVLEQVQLKIEQQFDLDKLCVGEKQRVLFARLLLLRPSFIFLDEPTSALDADAAKRLIELLYVTLPDSCIVIASHQLFLAQLHEYVVDLNNYTVE